MEITAGTVIADRFRLVCALGQGGMGTVWLARHTALDTPCAVKLIHEQAARLPDLRARFEREARAAALLRSPHVVQILDHGVWRNVPYIAMEYLEGEDLGQRLGRCGTLSPRETLAIAAQIGRALTKAHAAGLVHRDLKPGNVFIVRDEDREIAKVLDFGVAKVRESGLDGATKTGVLLGTPYYMSPEQTRGSKDIDHRSDLWALAVVIYQCLTGRLPFVAENLYELFNKIISEPLPVPSRVAPVPTSLDAWWARAAARDPGQRFQTARELTDALGVALGAIVTEGMPAGMIRALPEAHAAPPGPASPFHGGTATPYPSGALIHSVASISAHRAELPPGAHVGAHAARRRWRSFAVSVAALGLVLLALRAWSSRDTSPVSTPVATVASAAALASATAEVGTPAPPEAEVTVGGEPDAAPPEPAATEPRVTTPGSPPPVTAEPAAAPNVVQVRRRQHPEIHDPWDRKN